MLSSAEAIISLGPMSRDIPPVDRGYISGGMTSTLYSLYHILGMV